MGIIRKTFALPLLMLALATFGVAQTEGASKVYRDGDSWVEETTGTMPASRLIKIHTSSGSVIVTGAQQSNITYTIRKRISGYSEDSARRSFENLRVIARHQGESAYFGGEGSNNWRRGSVEFNITTPRSVETIRAQTDGGSLQFAHLSGKMVDAESGGGNINLDDVGGNVTVGTGGGTINVGSVDADLGIRTGGGQVNITSVGGRLKASTGGGNIHLETAKRDAMIETGGGNISVQNVGGDLRGSTGGGNIEVGSVGGTMDVETGGGSIKISGGSAIRAQTGSGSIHCLKIEKSMRAETGAGGITAEFMTMNGKFSDSTLETGVGDIIVYLPSDLKVSIHATIDVATSRDAIVVKDLQGIRVVSEGGDYGPREMSAEGNLNGGGPTLRLHTSTGKIEFIALKK